MSDFPAVGRRYLVDFQTFRVELAFTSLTSLTYTGVAPDGTRGGSETVTIGVENIVGNIFLVTWQEVDKTTVVHIENYDANTIVTNITNPDNTFEQHHGTFTEVVAAAPGLTYAGDIRPLFRDVPDIACMTPRRVLLADTAWMCTPANAARVFARLQAGTMPPDGPWPAASVATFKTWMDQGCHP